MCPDNKKNAKGVPVCHQYLCMFEIRLKSSICTTFSLPGTKCLITLMAGFVRYVKFMESLFPPLHIIRYQYLT